MTASTAGPATPARGEPRIWLRFAVAFLAGLLGVMALGAGALYAYDLSYEGRVLPGVRAGSVDLSGMTPPEARDALAAAYAHVGEGELVLLAGGRTVTIPYADLGRRVDLDRLVEEALGAGRSTDPLERVMAAPRAALRGVALEPLVVYDETELAGRLEAAAARLDLEPTDATVAITGEGIEVTEGAEGARADREGPLAQARAALGRLDAPSRVEVEIPVAAVEPWLTTEEAETGKRLAERMARDIDVTVGDDAYTIKASTVLTWLRLAPTVDGRWVPVLDVSKPPEALKGIAAKVRQDAQNASFLIGKSDEIVGVTAGRDGRRLDMAATTRLLRDALWARAAEVETPSVEGAIAVVKPTLSTEEAEQVAPLMERISTWTTYFPIGEKNGFGANIWIPAEDIDGYVVGPGEWFDFWKAIGPVTRERGYRDGGAIINGRTEPQGALAGGICSTSTTLFNAALRAGFEMGSRRNHYYYISRYPLGLDATVFRSSSGAVQTMSWRNDTPYPVLIRGYKIRKGNDGYVRFDLYSVPNGRKVTLSKPTVKNVREATDTIEYTSALAPGVSQRVEFPVDGMDVWVSRTVRDAAGEIIHRETYYSHYARITGITLVGKPTPAAADPASTP